MTGCTQGSELAQPSCESAVAAVTPIEGLGGMEYLVSDGLARSVVPCSGVSEWVDALQAYPHLVAMDRVSDADGIVYLAAACQLLDNLEVTARACIEGRDENLFG